MFISFLFFLVKEFFKFYHVGINGRKGVAWLVGYITPKNSWLIKWIKITSGEQVHHVQNTDVQKEMMKNIVSY
jgi:hypothetical protein